MIEKIVNKFGSEVKRLRIEKEKTLRRFCNEHGYDPGNHSKLERGMLRPPKGKKLEKLATQLGLKKKSKAFRDFTDLAYAERKEIPHTVSLSDKELIKKLPVLYCTLRGEKLTEEQLEDLAEMIRTA